MKLRNFLLLAGIGVAGCAGLSLAGVIALPLSLFSSGPAEPPPPIVVTAPVIAAPAPPPAAAPAGTEVDRLVLTYVNKNIGSDKLKDVSAGKPYKVNVYQDAGHTTANRVKVDLNRNEKWDMKFTFDVTSNGGTITRDVAPADDEAYTQHERWDGTAWVAN